MALIFRPIIVKNIFRRIWPRAGATPSVVLAILFFIAFFGASNWFRHVNLYTSQFDMGNMDQVLWQTLHGHWFQMADPFGPYLQPRTSTHADFLLLGYLPFYALWSDPRTMLMLQVIAVASGAIPLFLTARRHVPPAVGAFLAVLYLLYPTLQWAVTFDVHAVVLATPLFLWAWWSAASERPILAFVLVVLAMLSKEEIGLEIAALGIYWLTQPRLRKLGWASILVGIGWSALMVGWAIPHARQHPGHFALGYYSQFGTTPGSIVKNIVTHPWLLAKDIFNQTGFYLMRALWLPVGLLPVLGLPVFLIALPELALNLASSNHNLQSIYFQYMSGITPFIFLSSIFGWERAVRWAKRYRPRMPITTFHRWIAILVGGMALLAVLRWSPLPGTYNNKDAWQVFKTSSYRDDVERVRQALQPSDRVAATNNLHPQFSRREFIWAYPNSLDQADAVIVLLGGQYELLAPPEITSKTLALTKDARFTTVLHDRDFYFFRRAS